MTYIRPALVLVLLFTLLTGITLPLAFTGAATALVPERANGSLIVRNGTIVGSALIGQNFTADRYFHPRPSATTDTDPDDPAKTIPVPYNASSSGGSNLAPSSKALLDRVRADITKIGPTPVPGDMVTSSASGLDPDISPATAARQVTRVAAARGLSEDRVRALVMAQMKGRLLGFLGEPRINVLALNMALDDAQTR
ncbi:MAG TPA: potassium-transporting ATPase subunit KdpC [Acetobacteraceae bacterium]|nr:potassium-transporting ATPase subunit KdpC [Acetobacteraceae bacterium]